MSPIYLTIIPTIMLIASIASFFVYEKQKYLYADHLIAGPRVMISIMILISAFLCYFTFSLVV